MTCEPQQNRELNLAEDFVQHTGHHIFLTGKAGTGKTTFLHKLKEKTAKRMIVTAPTGVAAINAGGVTLHSFFQLPFGPFIPGSEAHEQSRQRSFRFSKEIERLSSVFVRRGAAFKDTPSSRRARGDLRGRGTRGSVLA